MIRRNSIFIIGNGFDIAHGLPTKYSDFSNHVLELIVDELLNGNQNDMLNSSFIKFQKFALKTGSPDVNNAHHKYLFSLNLIIQEKKRADILAFLNSNLNIIHSIIKNSFLAKLYSNSYLNWFDIENAFFEELVKVKTFIVNYINNINSNPSKRTSGELRIFIENKKKELIQLNNELIEIKVLLKSYLSTIRINSNPTIEKFFNQSIAGIANKKNIQIINFNYTNTIDLYSNIFFSKGHIFNTLNIHGNLDENIIFGYGNDNDNDYQTMLDLGIDEFLENFKTFEYLNNDRYSNFFKKTLPNLNLYDVFVIGHSLQQTDKTFLSGVFNKEKCNTINLLKRGDLAEIEKHKAFRKLTFATSRILNTDNDELRLKVTDYTNLKNFP